MSTPNRVLNSCPLSPSASRAAKFAYLFVSSLSPTRFRCKQHLQGLLQRSRRRIQFRFPARCVSGTFLSLFKTKGRASALQWLVSFLSPPSSRFWTREFLFPVRLRRKTKHVGMWRLTEDGINLDSYDTSSCKKKCNITKTTKKTCPYLFQKIFDYFVSPQHFLPTVKRDRLLEFWFRGLTQTV